MRISHGENPYGESTWDAYETVRNILGDEDVLYSFAVALHTDTLGWLVSEVARDHDIDLSEYSEDED